VLILCGQSTSITAGAGCATRPGVANGVAWCYSPEERRSAEASLRFQPFNPSALVFRRAGLRLTRVIVHGDLDATGKEVPIDIHYIFGHVPVGAESLHLSGAVPTFVDVWEVPYVLATDQAKLSTPPSSPQIQILPCPAYSPFLTRPAAGRSMTPTFPWEFRAAVPRDHILLTVTADSK
jgi:hypothetical protein